MRRRIALGAVFFLSLCVFLVALMPAAVVVERLPSLRPGGELLTLSRARGLWWDGSVETRWQDQQGMLHWSWDWRGLTPGLQLSVFSGNLEASGWLGAAWGGWRLEQWRATVPVAMISQQVPQGSADGTVHLSLMSLELDDGSVVDAKGTLDYSGGTVTWGGDGSAQVPPLDGRLFMAEEGPRIIVTGPDQQELMVARLEKQKLNVQVHRAWPQLLGVSQGGNPSDVVFQMSQPLRLGRRG